MPVRLTDNILQIIQTGKNIPLNDSSPPNITHKQENVKTKNLATSWRANFQYGNLQPAKRMKRI
jgi:hypothetical protein